LLRYVNNGQAFKSKVPYRPTLFVPAKEASDWNTLEGTPVSPTKFESIKEEFATKMQAAGDLISECYKLVGEKMIDHYDQCKPLLDAMDEVGWRTSSLNC
jgi:hypothetical protein